MKEGVSILRIRTNKLLNEEKGQALVLVALCLLVVFGFAAIAADAGLLYKTRRDMVASADASALAVAQEMADIMTETNGTTHLTDIEAQALAENYKGRADSVTVELITLDNGEEAVKASVKRNEEYFFGKLISKNDSGDVYATATATWGYPTKIAGGNVLPLFVQEKDFEAHEADPKLDVYLHNKEDLPGGNWGILDLYGNSNLIRDGLRGGFDLTLIKPLELGLPYKKGNAPGDKLSYTRDGIGESDKDIEKDGRVVRTEAGLTEMSCLVPIIKTLTDADSGKTTIEFVGFAYYKITDCVQNTKGDGINDNKYGGPYYTGEIKNGKPVPYDAGTVIGEFTKGITDIKVIAGDQGASHNYGLYYVDLID